MRTSEVCLLGVLHFFLLYGRLLHAQKLDDDFQPESHKNWKLLPPKNKCGKPGGVKIYGGYEPALGSYPWIARIGYDYDKGFFLYRCGGSLISDYYVLTAAHCIVENNKEYKITHVRLGEHNALTNPDCQERGGVKVCAPPVQDIPVTKVMYHEKFSYVTVLYYDVGLLRLKNPPMFSNYVLPVCLIYGAGMKMDFANENSTAAGWGQTENSIAPNILQAVSLKVWNQDECNAVYNNTNNDRKALAFRDIKDRYASGRFRNKTRQGRRSGIIESQVCAGGEGKSTCFGDSGGPLTWQGSFDSTIEGRAYLIGLTSGGKKCGSLPTVYTRISSFMRWILDHMEE